MASIGRPASRLLLPLLGAVLLAAPEPALSAEARRAEGSPPTPPAAAKRQSGDGPGGQTEDDVYIGKTARPRKSSAPASTRSAKPVRTGDEDDLSDLEVQRARKTPRPPPSSPKP